MTDREPLAAALSDLEVKTTMREYLAGYAGDLVLAAAILDNLPGWRLVPAATAEAGEAVLRLGDHGYSVLAGCCPCGDEGHADIRHVPNEVAFDLFGKADAALGAGDE